MKTRTIIGTVLLGVLLLVCNVSAANDVVLKDLHMFVDGKEFFIKAIAYQPAPLGIASLGLDGFGGTGMCSAKKTAFGEYKSACFGSDYYDGVTSEPNRVPPGPTDSKGKPLPYWYNTWVRDFTVMKRMGVNTLRIYNMAFVTKQFLELYPDEYEVTNADRAAQHKQFADLAHEYGFKLILPIVQDESFLTSATDEQIEKHVVSTVTELGDHPALIMWCLGNEMGLDSKPGMLDFINDKMQVVRDQMMKIHKRKIPVTHAVVDDPTTYDNLIQNLKVDVFTTNAGYRDIHMEPLWSGEENFEGWTNVSRRLNLPMFVGEFGMHQHGDEITMARPDWFNQQWKSIVDHMDDGTIGGCFFEYSDEINKDGMQKTMGAISFKESVDAVSGKSSLDENSWLLDEIVEKQYVYESVVKGLDDSSFKDYNFNRNVYRLAGRKQMTLDGQMVEPEPDPQVEYPTPKPSTSSPSPSPSSPPGTDPSSSQQQPGSSDSNNGGGEHSHGQQQSSDGKNGAGTTAVSTVMLAAVLLLKMLLLFGGEM